MAARTSRRNCTPFWTADRRGDLRRWSRCQGAVRRSRRASACLDRGPADAGFSGRDCRKVRRGCRCDRDGDERVGARFGRTSRSTFSIGQGRIDDDDIVLARRRGNKLGLAFVGLCPPVFPVGPSVCLVASLKYDPPRIVVSARNVLGCQMARGSNDRDPETRSNSGR